VNVRTAAPEQQAPRRGPQRAHDGNIAVLNRENCAQLFFVYAGGMGVYEGMGPMQFVQKSGIANRNLVFIRDPKLMYFDEGVSEEIPTMDAMLDWQQSHIASLPHVREVYCLGNSFGGWAALFFGYMLGVKKVWSLAPAGGWGRKILMDLMEEDNGVTDYEIYYSQQVAKDKRFAESLAGYPRVKLVHREEHGHQQINGLLSTGEFQAMMPEFRGVE
jgi:hypothetical protein